MKYKVMLAKIGSKDDLDLKDYIYEPKLDGIRALCIVNKHLKFITRTGNNITSKFPEFDFRSNIKAKHCILDGEIVVYNKKGSTDFNLLQGRDQLIGKNKIDIRAEENPATFVVFDILQKDRTSLLKKPLLDRKKNLKGIIKQKRNRLELIPFTKNGKKLWREMKKYKEEGVIAKLASSYYYPGKRRTDWLKIKTFKSADCVIIGYTQEKRTISALILGLYKDNKLVSIGKVGTGFDEETIKILHNKLKKIKTVKKPVSKKIKSAVWVKPKYVAEVKYMELTKDKRLRVPVFLRLRTDKKPKDCLVDQF